MKNHRYSFVKSFEDQLWDKYKRGDSINYFLEPIIRERLEKKNMSAVEWNCSRCNDYYFLSNIPYPTFECPNCGATDGWYVPDEPEPTHNED